MKVKLVFKDGSTQMATVGVLTPNLISIQPVPNYWPTEFRARAPGTFRTLEEEGLRRVHFKLTRFKPGTTPVYEEAEIVGRDDNQDPSSDPG